MDALLRSQDGRLGDLGESGRNFARIINRLQRIIRMVQASEEKTFGRTLQRWRMIDAPFALELGTERRGAGRFALIARWAPDADEPSIRLRQLSPNPGGKPPTQD